MKGLYFYMLGVLKVIFERLDFDVVLLFKLEIEVMVYNFFDILYMIVIKW